MEKINGQWVSGYYRIDGMHCTGCSGSVEKALSTLEGTRNVQVNLATEKVTLEYDSSLLTPKLLEQTVEKAGYKLNLEKVPADKLTDKRVRDENRLAAAWKNLLQAWVVTAPVMVWMILEMAAGVHIETHLMMESLLTLAAGFVIFVPGRETLVSAWRSAGNLNPNMDLLIAIGTAASLATGFIAVSHHIGFIHFPLHSFAGIAAMIMAFHLTGRYIETKARGRASDAITKLLTLEAETASVIRNGMEQEIPARDLKPGDLMLVRPGSKVPTDGEVVSGTGSVNESFVTGESMPVTRSQGDRVIGGTIVEEGSLRIKALFVGEETFLNRVVNMVEEAQNTRVPIQEYADRVTAIFVPVVLILSLLTFVIWLLFPGLFAPLMEWADGIVPWVEPEMGRWSQAFFAALAVLVIACPCALGLATPTALMVGTGLGAEHGVLIRRGEAIQRLFESKIMIFDKTGTLTQGQPEVTEFVPFSKKRVDSLIAQIRAVEYPSEHPISRAIVRFADSRVAGTLEAEEFHSQPGLGVRGRAGGSTVIIGNSRFMEQQEVPVSDAQRSKMEEFEIDGKTVVLAAVGGEIRALIAIADTLKPDAVQTVQEIRNMGFRTVMLTGDNQRAADAIGAELGFDEIIAGVMPDQKAEQVRLLQEGGERVVMVGDGVNDAPALAQADVGIAIGTGTDIAIESGSIVLVQGSLGTLLKAIDLSRATFNKIRQNLFWAYVYNVVMIPVAVAGLMHPVLAEAAMALSSVSVVGNSRRLQHRRLSPRR